MFTKKKKEVKEFKEEDYAEDLNDEDDEEEDLEVPQPQEPRKKVVERVIVVAELPAQNLRKAKLKDGSLVNLLTIEEALTELLDIARRE